MTEVSVPDLGDFADVPVIEIHVAPGDVVSNEDPLVTLESDKATMDIPSPAAGTVRELRVKVGDLVSRGSPILSLDTEGAAVEPPPLTDLQEPPTLDAADPVEAAREPAARSIAEAPVAGATAGAGEVGAAAGASAAAGAGAGAEALADFDGVHASPGVRRLARELEPELLVLLDLDLRDEDVFTLVDWLRGDPQARHLAVIVYSALDLDEEDRNRLRLGPTEFFTKTRTNPQQVERRALELLSATVVDAG